MPESVRGLDNYYNTCSQLQQHLVAFSTCGTVTLKSYINGETKYITLYDVLHIPTASDNLFSVGCYIKFGGELTAKDDEAYFYSSCPHQQLMIIGKRVDTLFHLNVEVQINEAYVSKSGLPTWLERTYPYRPMGTSTYHCYEWCVILHDIYQQLFTSLYYQAFES
jgi:hypothetical protein